MKKALFLFFALISSLNVCALPTDSISKIESEIATLRKENATLVSKITILESQLISTKNEWNSSKSEIISRVDSIKESTAINSANIKQTADELGVELKNQTEELTSSISNVSNTLGNKILWIIVSIALLLVLVFAYIILARRRYNSTDNSIKLLKDAQKNLETQSIKLDSQLIEILEKKMKNESEAKQDDGEPDHSLPLKVADEIVRIQNNIDRMDSSDRNVNRLNMALERMKTSFTAYGYEIVDMRGQEYTENMPFEVRFIPDDEIEEGKRIISGMDRLMVRYNGKMIQAPKLAVRQNV